jgi:hypothetical protein
MGARVAPAHQGCGGMPVRYGDRAAMMPGDGRRKAPAVKMFKRG